MAGDSIKCDTIKDIDEINGTNEIQIAVCSSTKQLKLYLQIYLLPYIAILYFSSHLTNLFFILYSLSSILSPLSSSLHRCYHPPIHQKDQSPSFVRTLRPCQLPVVFSVHLIDPLLLLHHVHFWVYMFICICWKRVDISIMVIRYASGITEYD